MLRKITYSVPMGPESDRFGMRKVSPSDAIVISDNVASNFTLSMLTQDDESSAAKVIYSVNSSPRKTKILSNTIDLQMTDVEGLHFKTLKKIGNAAKININGIEHDSSGVSFIYSNFSSGLVTYYDSDGKLMLEEDAEFFPMFIWVGMKHLEHIIKIDNKKFTYGINKGKLLISLSKPNVTAQTDDNSVFTLHKDSKAVFSLRPFLYRAIRNIDKERVVFDYDYSQTLPNISSINYETSEVIDEHYISFKHSGVIKDSIEVTIIDRATRSEFMKMTSIDNGNLNTQNGTLNIKSFLSANNIYVHDYLFITSYQYLALDDLSVRIDQNSHDLKNRLVYFNIKPTKITKGPYILDFKPTISYTITENDGTIVASSDSNIPVFEYSIPMGLGFGEEGYSENGYSGIAEVGQEVVANNTQDYGWGYGDLGYSEGPFGGSFIKNFEDAQLLLDAKSNSETGTITIAKLDLNPDIISSNIFVDTTVARPSIELLSSYDLFSGGVWHVSKSKSFSDISLAAGIHEYRSTTGIHFDGAIIEKGTTHTVMEFDISGILEGMNTPTQDVDPLMVLDAIVDSAAFDVVERYESFIDDSSLLLDNLQLFSKINDDYQDVDSSIVVHSDYSKVTLTFLKEDASNIGLGFKNVDNEIYPIEFIKI
jgi:hypothetical protein